MNIMSRFRFISVCLIGVFLMFGMPQTAVADLEEDIEASVAAGLAWLVAQQELDGSFGGPYCDSVGYAALAVAKLEDRALDLGLEPLESAYEYSDQVAAALAYIASHATTIVIDSQPAGNPDGDGDNLGVYFAPCGIWSHSMYQTGLAIMALSSSGDFDTYGDLVQDAVDFLAWAQEDSDCGLHRGGWRYRPNECSSDNSNTGYVVLGLAYAEAAPPLGFGLTIPQFVKDELSIWLDVIQDDVDGDPNDGGSWYEPGWTWVNILKTGNLLHEFGLVGDKGNVQRVQDAVDYIERHWYDAGAGDTGWLFHRQAMFTMMKGLSSLGIDLIDLDGDNVPEHDWFAEVAQHLIDTQLPDGSWPTDYWEWGTQVLSTSWALLTLEKAVPTFEIPVAIDIKPTSCPNPFNIGKKGVMPVAILGTEDFDVTQVDPATVDLAGVAPLRWAYEDVATPFEPYLGKLDAFECSEEEGDGYLDATFKFDARALAAALGDVEDGDVLVLPLNGFLKEEFGGTCIVGEDVIVILKK